MTLNLNTINDPRRKRRGILAFVPRIRRKRRGMRPEEIQPHNILWFIGFSGGKDSTLVLHLVVECVLELPHSERRRPVHVVANDTLVESPIVQDYVDNVLDPYCPDAAACS